MEESTISQFGSDFALVWTTNLKLVKVAADLVLAVFRCSAMVVSSHRDILYSITEQRKKISQTNIL